MSARKIAYNTVAQMAGKFLGFFISSFFLIILASHLGTVGMGYYTTVTAFVAFFVNLADLGINLVMMREIAQNPARRAAITGEFLGFRLCYSLAIMGFAPLVALVVPQYGPIIIGGVAIAALAQFILLINQTFVSVLQVSLQLDRAVGAEIVNRALTLGLAIVAAQKVPDFVQFYYLVLWITVVAALVNLVISFWFAEKRWHTVPRFRLGRWREIILLVLPMGLFSFLGMVHFKSDTLLLSLLKPAYDVGIYGYAYKIGEIMFSIPMMFIGIVFPRMSALWKEDKVQFLVFNQRVFQVLLVGALPFIVGVFLLAPYLTTLLSRQSLGDGLIAGQVLQILSLAMVAWFFGAHYQHILLAGTSYRGLIRNLAIATGLNLILNLIFIPRYSYFAAATITVLTEAVMLGLTAGYVWRTTGFIPRWRGIGPVTLATLIMGLVVWGTLHWLGPEVTIFAAASRPYQLGTLFLYSLIGLGSYSLALALGGKASPLSELVIAIGRKE